MMDSYYTTANKRALIHPSGSVGTRLFVLWPGVSGRNTNARFSLGGERSLAFIVVTNPCLFTTKHISIQPLKFAEIEKGRIMRILYR